MHFPPLRSILAAEKLPPAEVSFATGLLRVDDTEAWQWPSDWSNDANATHSGGKNPSGIALNASPHVGKRQRGKIDHEHQ